MHGPAGTHLLGPWLSQAGMCTDREDLGVSRLVGDSVDILHHNLEVYNSVQCLSCILTAQHFSWATFLLFLC